MARRTRTYQAFPMRRGPLDGVEPSDKGIFRGGSTNTMANEELTYASAMKELEEIVQKLQRPDCEIDQLCELTRRSTLLIKFCKERLTKTDEELVKVLDELQN